MTNTTGFPDQTAVLITHAAAWSRTTREPDLRPTIVQAVENWNRVLHPETARDHRPGPRPSRDADRRHLEAAAHRALRVYPGPAGELIHRELAAAVDLRCRSDIGYCTHSEALLFRLAEQVLTTTPPAA